MGKKMKWFPDSFSALAHAALEATSIHELLEAGSSVVLECPARGGGATYWYYCVGTASLQAIERQLAPGSLVSFYFDGRINRSRDLSEAADGARRLIAETGESFLGALNDDGVTIDMEIPDSAQVDEFVAGVKSAGMFFWGVFPWPDNDGVRAVTVTLPDMDGVVPSHPY
jgi:hypothetical protein